MSEYCVGFKSTPNLDNDPHDELEEERRELLDRLLQIESLLKYSEAKPEQTENTALLTEEITNENDLCSTTANLAFPCHSSFETPPPPIDIAMNGNQLEKSIDALPSKIKGHNSVLSYCTLAHHKPITLPEVLSVSKPPHSLGYSCLNKYQPVPQVSNVVLDQTQQDIANTEVNKIIVTTNEPRPVNWLIPAILACVCCFWPTGLCAISAAHNANKAVSMGDTESAKDETLAAKILTLISVGLGTVCLIVGSLYQFGLLKLS